MGLITHLHTSHNQLNWGITIFLSSLHWLHQKFLIKLIISTHRELGILKQLLVYIGIACATTFIKISLPAFDSNFSFQPASFLDNFSLISLKVFFLFLPTNDGNLRYFSCCLITYALNLDLISSWTSLVVLLLKNREVFVLLSYCPEACSYTCKIFCRVSHSVVVSLQKIILSFAKNKWDNLGPPLQTDTPSMEPSKTAFLINVESPLAQSKKR